MKKFEQIDISGDVGLRITGATRDELFRNAAEGMCQLITDATMIEEKETKGIRISADSDESLLIRWLNELIFLFDTYSFIGKKYSVTIQGNALIASVSGGTLSPEVHETRLLVKAATYHNVSVRQISTGWEAVVIFDI